MWYYITNLALTFSFGCLFGITEIFSRYNESKYLSRVWHFYAYLILNGTISVAALFLIYYVKNIDPKSFTNIDISNILIAGLGGMMILRSSIFTIKHKGEKVEIGLGSIAQVFLNKVEWKMKTNAGSKKMIEVNDLMKDIDFNKAKDELSSLCIAYIDHFSESDNLDLTSGIKKIALFDIDNLNKSIQLGGIISQYCDFGVLKTAINVLNEKIKISSVDESIDGWIEKLNK
jgi:hypothetical protein